MKFLEEQKRKKQLLFLGLGLVAVILLFLVLGGGEKKRVPVKEENLWSEQKEEDLWRQKWMVEAKTKMESQEEKLKALEAKQEKTQKTLEKILKELKELKEQKIVNNNTRLTLKTPPFQNQTLPQEPLPPSQPQIPPPQNFKPEVVTDAIELKTFKEPKEERKETQNKTGGVRLFIPPGTFVRGVLLSGVDAPTMGEGVAKEYPVLIELLDKAFLPNGWRMNVEKCFAVGWAKGDLASERAYIRIDRISCVTEDGKALVAQGGNFAAVYGEDGKVGLIGRVVAKEGTLLARALIAGFLQGVGQILQQSATVVNISPATGTTTTTVKPSQAVQYSLFGGTSKAAEILAKEYERLIKITFPVIEINAGRKVDVVFFAPPEFKEVCLRCENSTSQ